MKKCALLLILVLMTGLLSSCAVSETDSGEAAYLVCLNIGKADCMLLLYQNEA